ncbi:MAG: YadA-like family protein, partial [Haemophilus parainfluenzae]|nr:YadA-like family protein [Haemophilus parainfluenzae]
NAPFRGTAVGYGTKASDEGWATAIGNESNASGRGAIAMGNGAKSSGNDAIALGFITNASGENAVTIGVRSFATGKSASAYGSNTKASGDYSTAIGVVANTTGYSSTALGHRAKAEGHGSTALGSYSWSKGGGSAALGYQARAIGSTSIAIGPISTSSAEDAIALGVGANASGMSSIAIGESTKAEGYNSVALGSDSTNTHENSVALGSSSAGAKNVFNDAATKLESFDDGANSKTINYNGTSSYKTIINYGYSFTKESTGAVSVGDGSLVRQIQNVGAGRITATSNDAVNGSQLYQAYYNAGFNIQNNGTETSRINTHGKVNFVNGENTEVVVKDGENAAEIKVNAKDTSASVEAGSDAITVTVGEPTKVTGKDGVTVTTVTNYKVDLSQKTKDEIKNAGGRGFNVTASASEGTVVNEVTEETVQSTATKMDKLTLDAGKNIKLTHKKGKVLSVAVSDTPTFTNVTTTGDLNVGGTVHAHGGLDVHNNRIVNVADPKDPTDAVNKRYVDNAVKNINNNINRLDNKIDHVDRKLRAGIAGATAISFLQRPNEAGKSLVSVGVGGYRNENALAVGYGRNSDNNKVSIKVGASIN